MSVYAIQPLTKHLNSSLFNSHHITFLLTLLTCAFLFSSLLCGSHSQQVTRISILFKLSPELFAQLNCVVAFAEKISTKILTHYSHSDDVDTVHHSHSDDVVAVHHFTYTVKALIFCIALSISRFCQSISFCNLAISESRAPI